MQSAGDNYCRSKSLLHRCALYKFHVTDSQDTRDQITSDRRPNACDQIAFCTFHSFLVLSA